MSAVPRRFLALGDSYTIGEAVRAEERWTHQLAGLLRERGVDVAEPATLARTGWTSGELLAALDAMMLSPTFDLVTLLAGVNDQYRLRDVEEYRANFRVLLARAGSLAGGRARHVVAVSIPDWGVTPFADGRDRDRIAREIDLFNAINRTESARVGARYVDITGLSRRAAGEPALIAADGLHPAGAMYEEWSRLVLPEALAALEAAGPLAGA